MKTHLSAPRPHPVHSSHDVIVVGGGTSGVCAALAAVRTGARTLLLEHNAVFGGTMTMGLVTPLDATSTRSGKPFGGILWEIIERVKRESRYYFGEGDCPRASPQVMAHVLSQMITESGMSVLLRTTVLETVREGDQIRRLLIHNKSGHSWVEGKVFIDATGDGDIIAGAGEEFTLGSEPGVFKHLSETGLDQVHEEKESGTYSGYEKNGLMQPVTLFFTMNGVDVERAEPLNNRRLTFSDLGITREEFLQLPYANTPGFEVSGEEVPLPQGRVLITRTSRPGVAAVNMSRVTGVNGVDADSVSRAEVVARAQVFYLADFLKRFVPGFERSALHETAAALGIRETRRLVGRYVLTGIEAIRCVSFADAIAQGSYMIDIHDPQGRRKAIGGQLQGDCYDIPWRCLLPKTVTNLVVCGRCISADHVAHSSTRIQGTSMLTGQAAGTGAALAVVHNAGVDRLSPSRLQEKLAADGVVFHSH